MENSQDSCYHRDLLQRFTCGGGGNRFPAKPKEEAHERPAKVELSLGLSLNGRSGMEPQKMVVDDNKKDSKLFRASSVTDFVNIPVDVELSLCSPLTRTCSLPPETEAERRKRKELQSLRRSEAKRKRVEKLKNVRMVKGKTGEHRIELLGVGMKQSPPSPSPSPPPPPPPPPLLAKFSSQGSIGSQGSGGSSGVSELDSQPFQDGGGSHDHPNARSLNGQRMPCVSTKGDGVDGKKIQGFLYRYEKGEVRIVCVCHGTFLTPAEFVKHGGGTDVDHPLRHIIVNSSFIT